jgi:hypothetical protein
VSTKGKPFIIREEKRLEESRLRKAHWKRWGPYLSERQWGTVREDYSPEGTAWEYFPHDHARYRTYRWGEDGIGGICDRRGYVCFAPALWNGRDPWIKERLFGLSGKEGNHGEDVKEYYYYLDSTPTHSYMKFLYKYPQEEFPYEALVRENGGRGRHEREFELMDTGIFDENRYFDVFVEYAKASVDDILIRIVAHNRGPEPAEIYLLPTIWFRNSWTWAGSDLPGVISRGKEFKDVNTMDVKHGYYGWRWLVCEGSPDLLFTDNESNLERLFGKPNRSPYVKDGINEYIVNGVKEAVNPDQTGTKASALYRFEIDPGENAAIKLRLTDRPPAAAMLSTAYERTFATRIAEAEEFYEKRAPAGLSEDGRKIQRQAFAGMLWSKQFYYYDVSTWLEGDPAQPKPPARRLRGRNSEWQHLFNADVISMPDKWEYPWYAAWDLAFHCIPLALIDPDFAKEQLILLLREWYMHPNGQIPAFEWSFRDVNPPVHAWAAWRVYKIEKRVRGRADRAFLERVFHKLLLNFTWWVNRKDWEGDNLFQGGFLGLDNIGVFDRRDPVPIGGFIEQSDGTSWMGMYCLNMMTIALELARENRVYSDVASKFFEHFVYISHAMNHIGHESIELWDEGDGFYYDVLHLSDGQHIQMKVRSMVGLIPLFAVETLEPELVDALPGFKSRMMWFIENHSEFQRHVDTRESGNGQERRLLSIVDRDRLSRVLALMLDEEEFLSPYGIRSLSRYHHKNPYVLDMGGNRHRIDYEPAESTNAMFGGNSNWRGPVWIPLNYLIIEALQRYHHYFGEAFTVEFPTGSGRRITLWEVARELSWRLNRVFLRDGSGRRPVFGQVDRLQTDPHWTDYIFFHEYFHGDDGSGLGASHQTGWTGLVAKLIEQHGCE